MKKISQEEQQSYINEEFNKELIRKINLQIKEIKLGGGEKSLEKIKKQHKLNARERIEYLIDKGSNFYELGTFAGFSMYDEFDGAPCAGVVVGIGKINNRSCVIVANDATVKAGAWFPISVKKNLRAQEISIENNLPIIYLVDSAGVFLPLQDEIFPDKEHFGRIFRNNSIMSAKGILQIAAIMGPCVAGGAYLPIMSDEAIIIRNQGSVFLAGSHLVKAAIGEVIENEQLGGAFVQTNISGVTDYIVENDYECLDKIKNLISKSKINQLANFNRVQGFSPKILPSEIYKLLPNDSSKPYDMYNLIDCIIDENSFDEYKKGFGQTIITGYARIDGWGVGIVANQRKVVKSAKGEMQIGGVIYSDSADKAARFIMNCNQKRIPILFLQDVTGFMIGSKAEQGGIIKDGAKLVNVVANTIVPKITIIVGNSFGAGNYAMCGKAYDPRFIFAYPNAHIAVMGGAQASKVLLDIKIKSAQKNGTILSDSDKKKLLEEITNSYDQKSTPQFAAARLWVDEIIDPSKTRDYISMAIESANYNPYFSDFKLGVLQT